MGLRRARLLGRTWPLPPKIHDKECSSEVSAPKLAGEPPAGLTCSAGMRLRPEPREYAVNHIHYRWHRIVVARINGACHNPRKEEARSNASGMRESLYNTLNKTVRPNLQNCFAKKKEDEGKPRNKLRALTFVSPLLNMKRRFSPDPHFQSQSLFRFFNTCRP